MTKGAERQRQYRAKQRANGKRDMTIAVTHDQERAIRQYLNDGSPPVINDNSTEQEPLPWLKDLSDRAKWNIIEERMLMDMLFIVLPKEQACRVLDDVVLALRKATGLEHTPRPNTFADLMEGRATLPDLMEGITRDD